MSLWYTPALEAALAGDLDLDGGDPVSIALHDATFVEDASDEFFAALSGIVSDLVPLTGVTLTGGLLGADSVIVTGVVAATEVTGYVAFLDSGSAATSQLILHEDRNADSTPISFTATGLGITAHFPNGLGRI